MNSGIKKGLIISTLVVVLAFAVFIYFKFFFVFGEGVKAGELNRFVYKGYVFKTYEGLTIQSGFSSGKATVGSVQSNEFAFSVTDKSIADSLMRCGGRQVELRYKEYNGTLPWRGMSRFMVDEIISVN